MTLLLVDDEPSFSQVLKEVVLRGGKFKVVGRAEDGVAALKLVEKLRPEAVLMDVEMPVLDGFRTARSIRSRFPSTRVVLTSFRQGREMQQLAVWAGALTFMSKLELSEDRLWEMFQGDMLEEEFRSLAQEQG